MTEENFGIIEKVIKLEQENIYFKRKINEIDQSLKITK